VAGETITPPLGTVAPKKQKEEEEEEDMESSTEEQRNREETYNLYSPCYFFEQVIKAFLKCLGQDSTTTEDPPLHAERETKATVNLSLSLSLYTHKVKEITEIKV
jgi:hypothetical protein